jgi:apolipoprotein N-acyltransferase
LVLSLAVSLFAAGAVAVAQATVRSNANAVPDAVAVAVQPNVPMDPVKSATELELLVRRHVVMSETGLDELSGSALPKLVIWPESPMNFAYATDESFRNFLQTFAREHKTAVLFNSQEPAPADGTYNAALMVNSDGRLVAQYDKIRLLPFGEYVPLPHWIPGAALIGGIAGDFTAGDAFTLMPVGAQQAGVFICIEAAYPDIARRFTAEGAGLLINISNDGYLGPTAVMRQHLANAVFRAVENGRPLLRVTNSGITAFVESHGDVQDETPGFQEAIRTWPIPHSDKQVTFYTRHGDLLAQICGVLSLLMVAAALWRGPQSKVAHTR